ncbi:MAG: ATP-binding cassette domain-containing protein [Patescibacteria group bacterium]|nr:ATP-binding cassette domain-containing protein [Patescibacteria group bacterium]
MNLLELKKISKSFGGIKAVDEVSLEIEEGKIYSLIGPNGAGKTTLFNIISGFILPDEGKIIFRGEEITNFDIWQRASYLSRTFQLTRNFKNLNLKDNLLLSFDSPYENIFRFWQFKKKYEKEKIEIIKEFLNEIKFTREFSAKASEISYGQAKLLELTRAILKHHEILMLDEPVAGVNLEIREIIREILRKRRENGDTILLIEHDMNFVMDISDYVFVMSEGKLVAEGEPKIIKNNPKVLDSYLGAE